MQNLLDKINEQTAVFQKDPALLVENSNKATVTHKEIG